MICNECKCKDECGWYESYKKIEREIYLGIGTDTKLGQRLLVTMHNNPLEKCEYFEQ